LNDGYLGSGKHLINSIRKHGKENHFREILEFLSDRDLLMKREKEVVNEDLLKDSKCMNIHIGGFGGWSSETQRKNGRKGNEKKKWLFENDQEWKSKTSKNRSESNREGYRNGSRVSNLPNWSGKKHKEETKRKIGKANSIQQKGEKNSQFGKIWIHNEMESIKIKKEDLQEYLDKNWKKGRKMKFE